MTSLRTDTSEHEGAFLVAEHLVNVYMECFQPQVLRYDRRTTDYGYHAMNFGMAKGLQFERVLIVPTNKIRRYLRTGALVHVQDSREKLHVAITRASRSIAFVFDGDSPIVGQRWIQP
jgi:DNA helicase-2/ATP-dependent DNA helicase PcrA